MKHGQFFSDCLRDGGLCMRVYVSFSFSSSSLYLGIQNHEAELEVLCRVSFSVLLTLWCMCVADPSPKLYRYVF
ncbi:hypothetical protein K504DRAFT_227520 [Pleomassaria siparia CBS 279.74]|uniref:Uncharacterized protein n=1 Tax=Pleomassaria siparia CBS 279.74 TaxID=1314801 RepID=A0A6G1KFM6_9PLEO|nr:hypothetical protein K504DRAFT_227520 [Pleomassaria siparia CBS 279.74]